MAYRYVYIFRQYYMPALSTEVQKHYNTQLKSLIHFAFPTGDQKSVDTGTIFISSKIQ